MVKKIKYSFEQWCIDNNKKWLLDYWDENLNKKKPSEISARTNKKYWFWCGNTKHKPFLVSIGNLGIPTRNLRPETFCVGCHSMGEYISKKYGEEFLKKIWSDKNKKSAYEVPASTNKRVWFRCLKEKTHPDYDVVGNQVQQEKAGCPYCRGYRVCQTNSVAYEHPHILKVWDKKLNKDATPYDYTSGSGKHFWFDCEEGKHTPYYRSIDSTVQKDCKCPACARQEQIANIPRGKDSPYWNPNLSEDRHARFTREYRDWRTACFERDNYTCQCCGKHGGRLNVHHIFDFSKHKNLRYNVDNGITLCVECHDCTIKGSLHQVYGTRNVTPDNLEKYINDKRKEIGISAHFNIEDYINKIENGDNNEI